VKYASERKDGESRPEHIERVVQQFAGPAFWQEVAKAFPQVRTGDFGPEEIGADRVGDGAGRRHVADVERAGSRPTTS
jgi:hypothetical protein